MKALLTLMVAFFGLHFCLSAQTVSVAFDASSGINGGAPIPLLSFKIGAQQAGLVSQAGSGAGAGKSVFTPLTCFKGVDENTPTLFLACALGQPIKSATLTVSSSTGSLFEIILTNVVIASVNDDSTDSDGGIPFESFSMSYTKIGWSYTPIQGSVTQSAFDIKKNVSLSLSGLLPPQ